MRGLALAFGAFVAGVSVLASTAYHVEIARLVGRLPGGDLTGHFLLMGILAFLAVLGFASARVRGRQLGVVGVAALITALVTVDEVAQLHLPTRSFSWADLFASYGGIVAFTGLAWLALRLRRDPRS